MELLESWEKFEVYKGRLLFHFLPKMEEATVETLLALLQRLKLSELHQQLKETPELFHDWRNRSEAQWEKYHGIAGVDVFNHLNPTCGTFGLTLGTQILVNEWSSRFENFTVYHPSSTPVALLTPLRNLDSLLSNNEFLDTFSFVLPHGGLREILGRVRLHIRLVASKDYNKDIIIFRERFGEDLCCDGELGWFDPRVSTQAVYINYDYYNSDGLNMQWLIMLIFITSVHEISHFLVFHGQIDSPTHSTFGKVVSEAGECWEIENLGGIVSHAALLESPFSVKRLLIRNGTTDEYLSESCIEKFDLASTGKQSFPLNLDTTDEVFTGLQKYKNERHCIDIPAHRPYIPYTGPKLIKHERKPDRKGPRSK